MVFWATAIARWACRRCAAPVWWRPGRFHLLELPPAIAEDKRWSLAIARHLPVIAAARSTPWWEPLVLRFDLSYEPLEVIDHSARQPPLWWANVRAATSRHLAPSLATVSCVPPSTLKSTVRIKSWRTDSVGWIWTADQRMSGHGLLKPVDRGEPRLWTRSTNRGHISWNFQQKNNSFKTW
jgi:hypothetical protein